MSTTFYDDLDVESVLCCPVCYELPPNVIYLCKVGHHMCDKCRTKLTTCPTCQSALTGCRNFLAEALVSKFSILRVSDEELESVENNNDRNTSTTKAKTEPRLKLEENTNVLKSLRVPSGVFKCLLETCCNRDEMGVSELFPHVESVHTHLFDKFKNTTGTFKNNFENFCMMKKKRRYNRAFHVSNMGLFFLNLVVTEDKHINCWLSLPAPVRLTNRFDYEIKFVKEDGGVSHTFISKVASNIQTLQWLLERSRVLVLTPEEHTLTDHQCFSLNVMIVYKNPTQKNRSNET